MLDLLAAGAAFAAFLAAHVVTWHRLGAERAGFALMTGLWLGALAAVLAAGNLAAAPVRILTVIAVDGALMAFYLHLYTGMLRSVSLRVLGELDSAGGRLDRGEIDRVYSPESMLDSRLGWLVERRWIREDRGVYSLTRPGQRLLAVRRALAGWLVEGPTG